MTQMRRQSLVAYGQPLCETVVDCPAPRGNEVLLRIERCGVCHSDLHLQDGYFALGNDKRLDVTAGRKLPFTLGHEIAGVIESAGEAADPEIIGRRVAVYPWIGCGTCAACRGRRGKPLLGASSSRSCRRRRLRHPCAGSACALSPRLRAAVGRLCGNADVLGPDRLFGAQAACRPAGARPGPARRAWRRRHDGARDRAHAVSPAADRRRHRRRKARCGARRRRGTGLRSIRSAGAQGDHGGDRRRGDVGLRLRRLGEIACSSRPASSPAVARSW